MDEPETLVSASERERLISNLAQECTATVEARADRHLRVRHHGIVADTQFAPASAECIELFRDAHYYGAISLSQAVAEALVRHMCQSNNFRPANTFEENLEALLRRKFIDEAIRDPFLTLWQQRDDYHHLNVRVETDRIKLEQLAFTKTRTLAAIEAWVFEFSPGGRPGTLAVALSAILAET